MSAPTIRQRVGRWVLACVPLERDLIDRLRHSARGLSVRARYALLPTWRARARALRAERDVLLNVGSGPFPMAGFLNLDVIAFTPDVVPWDCTHSLPLADGAAHGIRAEHLLEHLEPRAQVPHFLAECRRALAPGGVLRVIVPDMGAYLRAYVADGDTALSAIGVPVPFPADLPCRMDVVAHAFHQWHEHRWGYDAESLMHRLRAAGFHEVRTASYARGRDARLAVDRDEHRAYSLYVEGVA